ncbi:dolichyl-phosphate beta-glucosyltransferase-like protein [Leptotrombidium deliense]|uniref:Dolichyl-phosphate beta-glucosyltransferase n=1 Tax=Leptotrombidium deliense TaxID=299467 RepID=A0A443SPZ8_9ACAR|nr:dolichyl-phosphate beta-glucosyltransferase-like protein [Leptotrombidium deliense]
MSCMLCTVFVFIAFFFLLLLLLVIVVRLKSSGRPKLLRFESEKYFLDPDTGSKLKFPDLNNSDGSVYLSVVVPAYNEEKRLPLMLDEALEYLEAREKSKSWESSVLSGEKFTYEIIVVDDGSSDRTSEVALSYSSKYGCNKVRVLTLAKNRGKGGAVRMGMLSSRGRMLLLADADGATLFKDVERLELYLSKTCKSEDDILHSIAIGSRKHLEEDAKAKRSLFRTVLMLGFHFIVWFFTVKTVRDTQCGFKLFGREVAKVLFPAIHVERWAFDVELLFLAEQLNIKLGEISVTWTEIDGSKIVPVFSWIQMGKDVLRISFMYTMQAWSIPEYNYVYNK